MHDETRTKILTLFTLGYTIFGGKVGSVAGDGDMGLVQLSKNYTGDVLNFEMGEERMNR